MTAHNDSGEGDGLFVAGKPLATIIAKHRRSLVANALDNLRDAIPLYDALPPEHLSSDIVMAIERGLRLFLTLISTGREPHPEELDEVRTSAARRAEEGVPLALVLEAYLVGTRSIVADVAAVAEPEDLDDLAQAVGLALRVVGTAIRTAVEAYVTEDRLIATAAVDERRTLVANLVAGRLSPAEQAALAPRHVVVHLIIGRHPDELDPSGAAGVAARRKLRRITTALAGGDGRDVLAALSPQGGLVIFSGTNGESLNETVDERLAAASAAAGAETTTASVSTDTDGVPDAASLAAELTKLAALVGRGPGHYRLDDLMVEHQLTRPGPARRALADQLGPLADRPELVETLRCHLSGGANRRDTAAALHLHPNSVDHRLRRIGELTGLHLGDPVGALSARAALLAWDAEQQETGGGRGRSPAT